MLFLQLNGRQFSVVVLCCPLLLLFVGRGSKLIGKTHRFSSIFSSSLLLETWQKQNKTKQNRTKRKRNKKKEGSIEKRVPRASF